MTPPQPPQFIRLNDLSRRYLAALQRLAGWMTFTWAGEALLEEALRGEAMKGGQNMADPAKAAAEFAAFSDADGADGTPASVARRIAAVHARYAPPLHMLSPADAPELTVDALLDLREEAHRWWLKNGLSELLGLCLIFMEDTRKIAALTLFNSARASGGGDLASLAAEVNSSPHSAANPAARSDFPARFEHLRGRYGLTFPMETHVLSLANLHRLLLETGGEVRLPSGASDAPDAPRPAPFVLHLKRLITPSPAADPYVEDLRLTWGPGERVLLSREEAAALFTTVSLFFSSTLVKLQAFGAAHGLASGDDTPPPSPAPTS